MRNSECTVCCKPSDVKATILRGNFMYQVPKQQIPKIASNGFHKRQHMNELCE
jgi:hypothetical protein